MAQQQIAQLVPPTVQLHFDRPTKGTNYRTALTTGTRVVQQTLGLTGAGIGVAVIDSGVTSWHDDLTDLVQRRASSGRLLGCSGGKPHRFVKWAPSARRAMPRG